LRTLAALGVPGVAFSVFYLLLRQFGFQFSTINPTASAGIAVLFLLIVGGVTIYALRHIGAADDAQHTFDGNAVGDTSGEQPDSAAISGVNDLHLLSGKTTRFIFLTSRFSVAHRWPSVDPLVGLLTDRFGIKNVRVEANLTSDLVVRALTESKYDMIHLDAPVEQDSILFSESGRDDELSAQAFARLVETTEAKIVILPSCNSFMLASQLPGGVVVIAASGNVTFDVYDRWSKLFYNALARGEGLAAIFRTIRDVYSGKINIGAYNLVNYAIR
jgi:hypothetical protein